MLKFGGFGAPEAPNPLMTTKHPRSTLKMLKTLETLHTLKTLQTAKTLETLKTHETP